MSKHRSIFSGLLLIVLGGFFLLKNIGFASLPSFELFLTYWPVILIIVGIALILKMRIVTLSLIALAIFLVLSYGVDQFIGGSEERFVTQSLPSADLSNLEVTINYGAGDLEITKGNKFTLFENEIITTANQDPKMSYSDDGKEGELKLQRKKSFSFASGLDESWNLSLNPKIPLDLHINYGAASAIIDLQGLLVNELDIESGASSTIIIFDDYPTDTAISMGASDLELVIPKDAGAQITIDGGAVSSDFAGFNKKENVYTTPNYQTSKNKINIEIDAGATSITARIK